MKTNVLYFSILIINVLVVRSSYKMCFHHLKKEQKSTALHSRRKTNTVLEVLKWNMKNLLFPGKFEVLSKTGKSLENEAEIKKMGFSSLLRMFQQFQNSICFSINGSWLLLFELFEKNKKKSQKLPFFSATKPWMKKNYEQEVCQFNFYVCSPNFEQNRSTTP